MSRCFCQHEFKQNLDTRSLVSLTMAPRIHSLVGAGAIVLPGTHIGKYCLIGSGAVVKGVVEDYAIVVGNPARKIGDTRDEKFKLVVTEE